MRVTALDEEGVWVMSQRQLDAAGSDTLRVKTMG
jgi:hypothetical protein